MDQSVRRIPLGNEKAELIPEGLPIIWNFNYLNWGQLTNVTRTCQFALSGECPLWVQAVL